MNLTSILGFLSFIGWVIAIIGGLLAGVSISQKRPATRGVGLAVLGVAAGSLFFITSAGLVLVGPAEVTVVYQLAGGDTDALRDTPLGPGLHVVIPIINQPFIYSTALQTYTMSGVTDEGQQTGDDAVSTRTRDLQVVYIDVSVIYGVDPAGVNTLHTRWQNRYQDDFVRPVVREAVRPVIAAYTAEELYGTTSETEAQQSNLDTIQQAVQSALEPIFEENGLRLEQFLIRRITFSEVFITAIENRQVAEQLREQAVLEAERRREEARGTADSTRITAEGEAQATQIRAQAQAEALRLINEQISANPNLIQYTYVQNLADSIRLILVPANDPFLFDFQQQQEQPTNNGSPNEALPRETF
jgi:prohibitin 2